mgnify:CR=1 FL=1
MNLRKTPRTLVLTAGYVALVHLAAGVALLLRYDGRIPSEALTAWREVAGVWTAASLVAFWMSGLYHGLWRYAGTATVFQILRGVTLSALAWGALVVAYALPLPRVLVPLVWGVQLVLLLGVRLAWRLWRERVLGGQGARPVRTLVIGADHAAVGLVQEMRRKRSGEEGLEPIGFVDADPRLAGVARFLRGGSWRWPKSPVPEPSRTLRRRPRPGPRTPAASQEPDARRGEQHFLARFRILRASQNLGKPVQQPAPPRGDGECHPGGADDAGGQQLPGRQHRGL